MRFDLLKSLLVLVACLGLTACAAGPATVPSYQTLVAECARIADRGERERCIDAAHRTAGRPVVDPEG